MTRIQIDPILAHWLRDGAEVGPEHGLKRALASTRRVRQRPGWTFPGWWVPTPAAGANLIPWGVLLGAVILTAIAVVAIAIGSGRTLLATNRPATHRNLLAYQVGSAIYLSHPDGSDRVELSRAVPFARLPVFSPDGTRVAFVAPASATAAGGRLLVVPIDGANAPIDVSRGIELLASDVPQMTWSPDSTRIAFSARTGGSANIFVVPSDGSGPPVPITNGTADRDVPTWSPDGTWIGFREKEPDGIRTRLRRVSPDGADVEEITMVIAPDAYLSKPRWRDGSGPTSYWYSPGDGSATSAYIDFGFTHNDQPWSGSPGSLADFGLPWSPDGTQLLILSRDDGVKIADYDPTGPYTDHVRTLGPVASCWVDWAPDGASLYGGSPDGCNGVVVIPIANPSGATNVPGSTLGVASWQPIGR